MYMFLNWAIDSWIYPLIFSALFVVTVKSFFFYSYLQTAENKYCTASRMLENTNCFAQERREHKNVLKKQYCSHKTEIITEWAFWILSVFITTWKSSHLRIKKLALQCWRPTTSKTCTGFLDSLYAAPKLMTCSKYFTACTELVIWQKQGLTY